MWQIVINGPGYFDTTFDLPEGATTLGRAEDNEVVLSGELVSRRHVRFHVRGAELRIEDLGSRNGTKLNGEPLTGEAPLAPGDTVLVGENSVVVKKPLVQDFSSTQLVDLDAGYVRFFGEGTDIRQSVVLSQAANESALLRALDNVAPFEMNLTAFGEDGEHRTPTVQLGSIFLLYKIAELVSTTPSLQLFLDSAIDRLLERIRATTAVVLVRNAATGGYSPLALRHAAQLAKGEIPVSDAIVTEALKGGKSLLVTNVRDDRRFKHRESVVQYGAEQVICVPIGKAPPFEGVLYLNLRGQKPVHLQQILDLANAVGHLISTAFEKYRAPASPGVDAGALALRRSVPPALLARAAAPSVKTCVVLSAEMFGVDRMVAAGKAEEVAALVNDFHSRLTRVVFSFEASVVSSGCGQAVAVFGAPVPHDDDGARGVRAALAIQNDWERQQLRRPEAERVKLRFGLAKGQVWVGNVGSEMRMDYTAFGEPVTASFEAMRQGSPGQIVATERVVSPLGDRFDITSLGEADVGGASRARLFAIWSEDAGEMTSPRAPVVRK